MAVNITASNVIWGPGEMYRAAFGATEPSDGSVATAPPASTWTAVGGTNDGVTVEWEQEFGEATFDQVTMPIESRVTRSSYTINTNMGEPTFDNFAFAMNATTTAASGSGYSKLSAGTAVAGQYSNYSSVIFDGPANSTALSKARFIGRKVLNTSNVSLAYTKDNMTVLAVALKGHFVSGSVDPWVYIKAVS